MSNAWVYQNSWQCSWVIVGIVAVDAQLLKHQAISIHNTDAILVDPEQFMEQLVLIWINLESKTHLSYLMQKKYF